MSKYFTTGIQEYKLMHFRRRYDDWTLGYSTSTRTSLRSHSLRVLNVFWISFESFSPTCFLPQLFTSTCARSIVTKCSEGNRDVFPRVLWPVYQDFPMFRTPFWLFFYRVCAVCPVLSSTHHPYSSCTFIGNDRQVPLLCARWRCEAQRLLFTSHRGRARQSTSAWTSRN